MSVDRRVALITGASRGIGAATARRLSSDGFSVVLTCRSGADAAQAVAQQCSSLGAQTLVLTGDCADPSVCKGWVDAALERFGRVDALINNAGKTHDGLLMRMSDEQFDDVLRTNLYSAFYLMRAVCRPMLRAKYGRIVNLSSVAGVSGNVGQSNYAASKAGLIGLTKSVAKELGGKGITVNAVAPGAIETDMTQQLPEENRSAMTSRISLGRMGTVEEVAAVIAFLASESSSYLTGQVLTVDGSLAL